MATSGEVPTDPESLATPSRRTVRRRRWTDEDFTDAEQDPEHSNSRGKGGRRTLRWIAGLIAILGTLGGWIFGFSYSSTASAIQVTQVYAGGILVITISLGFCIGLYVISRAGD